MEVRQVAIWGFFAMMSINAFAGMLNYVEIEGSPFEAWDTTQFQTLNVTETVESSGFETTEFYDIGGGFLRWWYKCVPYVEAFPQLLEDYNVPSFIYNPIHDLWRVLWFTFATLVLLAGRNV